jgi:hypothetical protein
VPDLLGQGPDRAADRFGAPALEELLVEPVDGTGASHFLKDEGELWQFQEYAVRWAVPSPAHPHGPFSGVRRQRDWDEGTAADNGPPADGCQSVMSTQNSSVL